MSKTIEMWLEETGSNAEFDKLMKHPILIHVLRMILEENGPGIGLAMASFNGVNNDFKFGYVSGKADCVARLFSLAEQTLIEQDLPNTYEQET
jgi:hypothetical protein